MLIYQIPIEKKFAFQSFQRKSRFRSISTKAKTVFPLEIRGVSSIQSSFLVSPPHIDTSSDKDKKQEREKVKKKRKKKRIDHLPFDDSSSSGRWSTSLVRKVGDRRLRYNDKQSWPRSRPCLSLNRQSRPLLDAWSRVSRATKGLPSIVPNRDSDMSCEFSTGHECFPLSSIW